MAVIFSDTFTEASDTTLTAHTPNVGTSWSTIFVAGAGVMDIIAASDNVQNSTGGLSDGTIYTANTTYATNNYYAQVQIDSTFAAWDPDDPAWLVLRVTDANNFYGLRIGNAATQIYKKVGGTITAIGATITVPAASSVIKFSIRKNKLEVYDDGVLVRSVVDNDIVNIGKAALAFGDLVSLTDDMQAQIVDNFEVGENFTPSFRLSNLRPRIFAPGFAR